MATNSHNINVAIARCDLERIVREHIHGGVLPGELLDELLDMCVNLRDMARIVPANHDSLTPDQDGASVAECVQVPAGVPGAQPATDAGARVRWLRPVSGPSSGSGQEHHVQGEADTDQRLAHD